MLENKEIIWICNKCNPEIKRGFKKIQKLEEENIILKDRLRDLEDKVSELGNQSKANMITKITDRVLGSLKETEE